MAIDKADWHWDDTEKLYRKTNNVEGKMSGAEYLMHILDGAFCENDIKPNVRDFAVNYYDKQYFNDYGKTCPAKDLCVPCYSFISGDDDYNALRPLIDEAYEEYCREK